MFDDTYLRWLITRCGGEKDDPAESYTMLLSNLYAIPFHSDIPNDINRIEDGRRLREEYENLTGRSFVGADPVSVLEVLIALADRLDFQREGRFTDDETFWELLENLDLIEVTDERYAINQDGYFFSVNDQVQHWMDRRYQVTCFPGSTINGTELWYQMMTYVENTI